MKEFKNFSKIAKIQMILTFVIFVAILAVICFGNFSPEFNGVVLYSSFLTIVVIFAFIFDEEEKRSKLK